MKPSNYKPKITASKQAQVEELKAALLKYNVTCIFNLSALPSKQLQLIRHKLRNKVEVYVKKKRLINRAITEIKAQKNLVHLLPFLDKGIPGLILTNQDPFSVYKIIKASKSLAAAKPGQLAPKDLIVEAGPTNFPPGPIIGELGQAGIIAAVEQGKVVIKKETLVAGKGEVITQKKADVLAKLGIQPMEIGMAIIAALQDGVLYSHEILDVDEQEYINNLRAAAQQAYNFTILIGYITKDNLPGLIGKAFIQAKHIAEKHNLLTSETIKNQLKKAEFTAISLKANLPELPAAAQEAQPAPEAGVKAEQPLKEEKPYHVNELAKEQPKETSHVYSKQAEEVAISILDALKEQDIKAKQRKAPSQVYSKADEEKAKSVLDRLKDKN